MSKTVDSGLADTADAWYWNPAPSLSAYSKLMQELAKLVREGESTSFRRELATQAFVSCSCWNPIFAIPVTEFDRTLSRLRDLCDKTWRNTS